MIVSEIISKKRNGNSLSKEEIEFLILGFAQNTIPDYQMSAFMMSVYFQGMNDDEIFFLTDAMMRSGDSLDFSDLSFPTVDKHSTGGVGDKTSLILGPIVACYDVGVPMIAGRGLGHTGGTIDKLESIPGFNSQVSLEKFKKMVRENRLSIIAQTPEICPADKKMYALRDVTATVESIPLICGSIMSKKLAEGAGALVLDVKFGSGAFMESVDSAEKLAFMLQKIGKNAGRKVTAFITSMDQPLGQWCGNSVEIQECIEVLKGEKKYPDILDLSLALAAEMLTLVGIAKNYDDGLALSQKALDSGAAFEKFEKTISLQGGNLNQLPKPTKYFEILSPDTGFLSDFRTKEIGYAGIELKAGREKSSDKINPVAGIRVHKKLGDSIQKDEPLFTIFSDSSLGFDLAQERLASSFTIGPAATKHKLIQKILR